MRRACLILATLLLAQASLAREPWHLWPRAEPDALDQAQTQETKGNRVIARPGAPVGQTFVPRRTPLFRIELQLNNVFDERPGQLRLYAWRGSYAASVAAPPLFEDVLELSGGPGFQYRSVYPRLDVEPGRTYLVELSAEGRGDFAVQTASGGDRYPEGKLFQRGREDPRFAGWDLWFRSHTTAGSGVAGATHEAASRAEASNPRLRFTAPGREPASLTREAYRERIRRFEEARGASLNACRERGLERSGMLEAFLYKASCEEGRCAERHAENVAALFRSAHASRLCTPRPPRQGRPCQPACDREPAIWDSWWQQPLFAYLWTRSSGVYSARDHARIRELFVDSARLHAKNLEDGIHSRPLKSAVGMQALAKLYPEHAEAGRWRAYADRVWREVQQTEDSPTDSSQYLTIHWLPAMLDLAELRDESETLWREGSWFRALVENQFQRIAPLGTDANFGDGSGWARDPAGLVWLFEEAAARTGEARYRWLAHRLFTYNASRDRTGRGVDSLDRSIHYLGRAWLAADETLTPKAPAPRREVLQAGQTRSDGGAWPAPVGQRFVATASPLARIDVRVREADGPVQLSLWPWRGSREATRAEPPRFRDALTEGAGVRSVFPLLPAEPGSQWYFEVEGQAVLAGSRDGEDAYAEGALQGGGAASGADLWFTAHTLSPGGSVVTRRREMRILPFEEWNGAPIRYRFGEERVPGKLVLRSGFDPDDLHAVVNLLRRYGHGQDELGAFVSLVDDGSVLLVDGPFPYAYFRPLPEDESIPFLRRYWGGESAAPGRHARVTHFSDGREATAAWLAWDDIHGWGVAQERRIYFVKNGFLWVRDRFTFPHAMRAAAGPVWHAADVHPESGDTWWDVYYREPLTNAFKLKNPGRRLLTWFAPREGYESAAFREPTRQPPERCRGKLDGDTVPGECRAGPGHVLYQRWSGDAEAGTSRWFDTLLLPHAPERRPDEVAADVRALHVGAQATALEVRIGEATWTLVASPDGAIVQAGDLDALAGYALLRTAPGRAPYLFADDARRVVRGDVRFAWDVPVRIERGAGAP